MKRVKEEISKLDKSIKIFNQDVLTYLVNNGMYENYSDLVKQAVKRV